MKRMLLILMILASAAMAGDRQMKALLVGTWDDGPDKTQTFRSDRYWIFGDDEVNEPRFKWDIKGGKLIEIHLGPAEAARYYVVLLLTKHEFLARETAHGRGYIFLTRSDTEDP
jgi:hypothetical protein